MPTTYYEKPKRIDKLSNSDKIDLILDLVYAMSLVRKPIDTALFLQDLLTANEIKNLATRLRIAKLLIAGVTQREISKETKSSTATVNKVNIWLKEGGKGFQGVISKLPLRWKKPNKLPSGPLEFHLPQLLLATGEYVLANRQEKLGKEILGGIKGKEILDKEIRERNRQYYSTIRSIRNSKKK